MIKFQTKDHADVVMFEQVAVSLIKKMGFSGQVPSAIEGEQIDQALQNLKQAASRPSAQSGDDWEADSVSLAHRAKPLIDLLTAAKSGDSHVIWEKTLR